MSDAAIEVRGLTKRFGDCVSFAEVDLVVPRGAVTAVVGENGAGKSTLMNVLYGIHRPDAGEVRVDGTRVAFRGPADAIAAGIGMVHQHFHLVRPLTVAENVTLGAEPRAGWRYDARDAERRVAQVAREAGFDVDPRARIEDLSVGAQQRVEILKCLARGARILILDEPTAVLTPQEVDELFRVLRTLVRDRGRTVLFISHKLGEVTALADRIAVMRAGRMVAMREASGATPKELATLMVGRELAGSLPRGEAAPGSAALAVEDLHADDDRGLPAVRGVSLEVRAGEIVGLAGVEGNGQTELVEVLTGLRRARSGRVILDGRALEGDARAAFAAGIAHVPGDRLDRGVVADMTVAENLVLGRHRETVFAGRLAQRVDAIRRFAGEALERFDVRPRDPAALLGTLSGGNQQKLVVARELGRAPRVLIAVHPTRGVDVGAIEEIHRRMLAERDRGTAVLLVSADLGEILALSDRVGVIYGGRIVRVVPVADSDERRLGGWMAGTEAA